MRDEEPFFPTRIVIIERVRMDLGLEEGGRSRAIGEREKVVARTVVVHSWDGGWRGGLGQDQSGEGSQ